MARHETRTERVGRKYRWACTCGQQGDATTKARAETGEAYHAYGNRPMTADEYLTMGDGMNAGATLEEAQARADAENERRGYG
jgi:hypothetical protein